MVRGQTQDEEGTAESVLLRRLSFSSSGWLRKLLEQCQLQVAGEHRMNIPTTGPNPAKVKFFREVANSFEFLSIFYTLSEQDQLELMQTMLALQSKGDKK